MSQIDHTTQQQRQEAVETLWSKDLVARFLQQQSAVELSALRRKDPETCTAREIVADALGAVVEAVRSQYSASLSRDAQSRDGQEQSFEEFFSDVRTYSFEGVTFVSADGELRFNGFVKLLEYANEKIFEWVGELDDPRERLRFDSPISLEDEALALLAGHPASGRTTELVRTLCTQGPASMLNLAAAVGGVRLHDEQGQRRGVFSRDSYHIRSLELFNPQAPPEERLRDLQDVFHEIVQHQFDGEVHEYDLAEGAYVVGTRYSTGTDESTISGHKLIDHYAQTLAELYPEKHKFKSGGGLEESRRRGRVMRHVRDHALGSRLTRGEELSLFAAFDYQPHMIFQAWALIEGSPLSTKARENFLTRYPGLQTTRPEEYYDEAYPAHQKPKSPRKYLTELVLDKLHGSGQDIEARKALLTELILSTIRKDIQARGRTQVHAELEASAQWFDRLIGAHSNPGVAQLLVDAHTEVAKKVVAPSSFLDRNLKVPLQEYQREGASFLIEKKRCILGDSYSLGKTVQAVAAAESAEIDQVLWVTDASNRLNVEKEIKKITNVHEGDVVVIPPPSEWDQSKIEFPRDAKYVVVSYSTLTRIDELAKVNRDWKTFAAELRGSKQASEETRGKKRALVLDESQLVDNPNTLRSKAVRRIECEYAWLLSATPFQNKVSSLYDTLSFLDPDRFGSRSDFRDEFLRDEKAFDHFLTVFDEYFLGRNQTEVAKPFADLSIHSAEEQLADGIPRFAGMQARVGTELDTVHIPAKVNDLYLWMFTDFFAWAAHHNEHVHTRDPERYPQVDLGGKPYLQKFGYCMRALYEPQKFGLPEPDYIYQKAYDVAAQYLQHPGKKVVCFGENLSVLEGVKRRIGREAEVFSGSPSQEEREDLRARFEQDSGSQVVRVLLVQARCGGIGLSFRRADAVINLQPYQSISQFGQVHGRVPRNVYPGEENIPGIAKVDVPYHYIVPELNPEKVAAVEDPVLKRALEHGSIARLAVERLLASNRVYEFLRSGFGGEELFERFMKSGIMVQAGLLDSYQPLDIDFEQRLFKAVS